MHPIVRASLYIATGGVVVGGSVLTIPTTPVLAVVGVAAGTIVLIKWMGKGRKNAKVLKNKN
jgi:hypothetical protein